MIKLENRSKTSAGSMEMKVAGIGKSMEKRAKFEENVEKIGYVEEKRREEGRREQNSSNFSAEVGRHQTSFTCPSRVRHGARQNARGPWSFIFELKLSFFTFDTGALAARGWPDLIASRIPPGRS